MYNEEGYGPEKDQQRREIGLKFAPDCKLTDQLSVYLSVGNAGNYSDEVNNQQKTKGEPQLVSLHF